MTLLSPEDPGHGSTQPQLVFSSQGQTEQLIAQILTWLNDPAAQGSQVWEIETRDAVSALALWLLAQHRPQEAASLFECALRHQPEDVRLLKGWASALEMCGDALAAHPVWQRLIDMAPQDLEHRFLWAQSLWRIGEPQQCWQAMQPFWQLGPENAELPAHVRDWIAAWRAWWDRPEQQEFLQRD